jgi:integrase
MQRGYVFRKGKAWYGRWRRPEIIKDASGNACVKLVQHCEKLCDYGDEYRTESDVRPILDEKLAPLNEGRESPESTLSVCEYAEKHFLPWADRELRPATAHGYRTCWKTYLRPRLQEISVRSFRCVDATNLLADLHRAHGLSRTTLSHVKGLLGVIFTHAKRAGVLDSPNPVRDAGIPRKAKPGKPTHAYTPQEIVTMLDALEGTAKNAIAVMYFTGLRPAEACGLKWCDYDAQTKTITVSRSRWRGLENEPKTKDSNAPIPVPRILADILDTAERLSEYVLTSPTGKSVDLHNLSSRVIRPALAKCATCKKEKHAANGHEYAPIGEWHGFYAGRRGCATLATSLETPLAAKGLLRHSNVQTTAAYYIKSVPEDALRASQKIDALFSTETIAQ